MIINSLDQLNISNIPVVIVGSGPAAITLALKAFTRICTGVKPPLLLEGKDIPSANFIILLGRSNR